MAKGRSLVDMWVWNRRSLGDWSTSGTSGNAGILLGRLDGWGCKSGMGSTCTSWNPVGVLQRDGSRSLHGATGSGVQPMSVCLGGPRKALGWECWTEGQAWSLDAHLGSTGDAGLEKWDGAWALDRRCGQLDGRWGVTFRNKNSIGLALIELLHVFLYPEFNKLYNQKSSLTISPNNITTPHHSISFIEFEQIEIIVCIYFFVSLSHLDSKCHKKRDLFCFAPCCISRAQKSVGPSTNISKRISKGLKLSDWVKDENIQMLMCIYKCFFKKVIWNHWQWLLLRNNHLGEGTEQWAARLLLYIY